MIIMSTLVLMPSMLKDVVMALPCEMTLRDLEESRRKKKQIGDSRAARRIAEDHEN